jgi:hypothetical protein
LPSKDFRSVGLQNTRILADKNLSAIEHAVHHSQASSLPTQGNFFNFRALFTITTFTLSVNWQQKNNPPTGGLFLYNIEEEPSTGGQAFPLQFSF